ncbi:MAG: hypothetical protein ACOVQM_15825, partial [Pirellula sp.]
MLRTAVFQTFILGCSFLSLLSGTSGTCLAQKTLAWKLPQGRILQVQMDQTTKMKLDGLPPAKAAMASNTTLQKTEMTWAVLDVSEEKTARVEQAVSRIV